MSNALAIAAVTATLKYMINDRLAGYDLSTIGSVSVTAMPPDRVDTGTADPDQLNLFLYQVTPNLGWRNVGLPSRDASGNKLTNAPLAIDLHYILTAYGSQDLNAEILLGYAMQILHETPMLTRAQLTTALSSTPLVDGSILPGPFGTEAAVDLANQVEQVKISPVFLSMEDLSKMWTAMQAKYRPTMAYMISVILIQATDSTPAALPVLTIGPNNTGPVVGAAGVPVLSSVQPAASPLLPAARLGDQLLLTGANLNNQGPVTAQLEDAQANIIQTLPATPGTVPGSLVVQLPTGGDTPSEWAAGTYEVSLLIAGSGSPSWTTNAVPVALAPTIEISPLTAPAGAVTLTVSCTPQLQPIQASDVLLIFGSQTVAPTSVSTPADPTKPTTVTVDVPAQPAGTYVVRLRIGGVDSLPITFSGTPPTLAFDPNQMVTLS